jgi:hypothetical protein
MLELGNEKVPSEQVTELKGLFTLQAWVAPVGNVAVSVMVAV